MPSLAWGRSKRSSIRRKLRERDGNVCNMCGIFFTKIASTIDHIQPTSRGGTNNISNLQLLCRPCNNYAKRNHTPIGIFLARTGREKMDQATDKAKAWEEYKRYFAH